MTTVRTGSTMASCASYPTTGRGLGIAGILFLATIFQLPYITAPLADNLQIKQVYVANKARNIARTPLNPFRNSLDFLDDRGGRITLTEEAPLYTGLLALAYRLLGEHDWVGRVFSLVGTIAALGAYADLVRREHGRAIGTTAAFLLAVTPLLVFYGRAVMPDTWMLAAMIIAATCYHRYLAGLGLYWLIGAVCAASLAPIFKYYGVMVLVPLAGMTLRSGGSRWGRALRFGIIVTATLAPIGLWTITVFLSNAEPGNLGMVRQWQGDALFPVSGARRAPSPWVLSTGIVSAVSGPRLRPSNGGPGIVGLGRSAPGATGTGRKSPRIPSTDLLVGHGRGILLLVWAQIH